VPWTHLNLASLSITVQLNGQRVQTVRLSELVRPVERLLADVGEFMSLRAGDVLMLGTDVLANGQRPRARAGDTVCLSIPGFAPWVQTVQKEAA
jgi:5-oxopent-3-ene-1,2,5-tricarboxylate decarboxylase/2-hydroxyhepta-2,4-diene-1,7-dioate isomerase